MPLRKQLAGHDIVTAFEAGWSEVSNGELLAKAEEQFDVLVTTDKQLHYQQNLSCRTIAILVLPYASWPKLESQAPKIADAEEAKCRALSIADTFARRMGVLPPRTVLL